MPTRETWRTYPAAYPFSSVTETRFQDLDVLGHINNVAMAALFENGRVRFNRSMQLERREKGERWLIARVEIDYLAEGHFPADVTIASGIGRIGRSSWDIAAAAFQNERCIATCVTTLVLTDKDGTKPIRDDLRTEFERRMVKAGS